MTVDRVRLKGRGSAHGGMPGIPAMAREFARAAVARRGSAAQAPVLASDGCPAARRGGAAAAGTHFFAAYPSARWAAMASTASLPARANPRRTRTVSQRPA